MKLSPASPARPPPRALSLPSPRSVSVSLTVTQRTLLRWMECVARAPPPPPPPQPAASREDGDGADQSRPDGAAQKQPVSDAGVSDFDLL